MTSFITSIGALKQCLVFLACHMTRIAHATGTPRDLRPAHEIYEVHGASVLDGLGCRNFQVSTVRLSMDMTPWRLARRSGAGTRREDQEVSLTSFSGG